MGQHMIRFVALACSVFHYSMSNMGKEDSKPARPGTITNTAATFERYLDSGTVEH